MILEPGVQGYLTTTTTLENKLKLSGGEDKRGLHYCLVSFRWLKITKKHSYILQKNNKNVLQQNIITCSLRIYLYNTIPRNGTCTEKKYMNFT